MRKNCFISPVLFLLSVFLFVPLFAISADTKDVIEVKEGVSLSSQMNKDDVIYKISYAFDLKGGELHVPDGCVLLFDGGSIENGTIYFSDTDLCGYPQIRCKLQGSIPKADITWFGARRNDSNHDVGAVINQIQGITSHIIIPAGDFYQINEAVRIEGNKYIDWIGNIHSVCTRKQYDAFTISSGVVTLDMKGSLICKSSSISYLTQTQTAIYGLVLENINNSTLNVGTIRGFNTGIKVFGHGGGCSYNMFSIKAVRDCNTGMLITQRDKDGKIGWANENTFIGGRFGVNSSWDTNKRETHAIVAKGIYKDDTYNKVNSLYFLRPCAEGNYVPFVFNNAEIITVEDCRSERGVIGAKLSGRTNRVHFSNSSGSSLNNLDISDLDRSQSRPLFRQKMDGALFKTISFEKNDTRNGTISDKGYSPQGCFQHMSYRGVYKSAECPISNGDVSEIGADFIFEKAVNVTSRLIDIEIAKNQSGNRRYLYLVVKETHDGKAAKEEDILYSQGMSYNSQNGYWVSKADLKRTQIIIGENVKKVAVVFRNVSSFEVSLPLEAI